MFFKSKLVLVITVGSVVGYFIALTALQTTDHMADNFTVENLPDLGHAKPEAKAAVAPVVKYAEASQQSELSRELDLDRPQNEPDVVNDEPVREISPLDVFELVYTLPAKSNCELPDDTYPTVGVRYRSTSYSIMGQSLADIDKLIALYKKCSGGNLMVLPIEPPSDNPEPQLAQRRQDEIKYYLLQRRIDKNDIILSDNS